MTIEFPVPSPHALDVIYDGLYMYASTFHWQPILNGYSGFYPQSYLELLERMQGFPDEPSIDYLKRRGVDLIVLARPILLAAGPGRVGIGARREARYHADRDVSGFLLHRSDFPIAPLRSARRGESTVQSVAEHEGWHRMTASTARKKHAGNILGHGSLVWSR